MGTTCMEEAIEKLLVAINQGIELMRQCKYDMEIRGIDYLCPAFIYPEFCIDSLTVRAAAVAAGIIVEFGVPAVRALGNVAAEPAGFAVEDGKGGFVLDIRLEAGGRIISIIGIFPYLLYHKVTHQETPPMWSKGLTAWEVPLAARWT